MELEQLLETIPDYAKDLKLNLNTVLRQTELTGQQAWGTALACAIASGSPRLISAIRAEAAKHISEQASNAAKAAAAVMDMNNILYRFRHYAGNPKYGEIPARLRMQAIRTHGSDPLDFELWCLAVSAVNGCEVCIQAHEKAVREKGANEEAVMAAVRIASTVFALSAILEAEAPR
jgi:alkyl hydroperoxide reductase subunit D